jgi:hypothetical protein
MTGFTYGYRAMLVRDIISFSFYFTIYEFLRDKWTKGESPFWWKMICGGTSGVISWGLGFPFDSLKLRMQTGLVNP